MKISQLAFIQNVVIEKRLTECNTNAIPMKTGSAIKMTEPKNNENANLCIY